MFKKKIKRKGDILFKAGDITDALYVIESGEVDVVLPYSKKRYTRLAKLTTGCFIGEPNFLQISKASVEARVVKNSNLLVLTREEFNQLFHTQPRTAAKLLAALGHQMSDQFNYLTHKLSRHANFNRS